jgi:hypothetical protein
MSTNKGKERVLSPTGSIIITTAVFTVLAKDTFLKVKISDTFSGDRKKFKAYEIECRVYF